MGNRVSPCQSKYSIFNLPPKLKRPLTHFPNQSNNTGSSMYCATSTYTLNLCELMSLSRVAFSFCFQFKVLHPLKPIPVQTGITAKLAFFTNGSQLSQVIRISGVTFIQVRRGNFLLCPLFGVLVAHLNFYFWCIIEIEFAS